MVSVKGVVVGLGALGVLCCTLGAAYAGRRPLARGMGRSNELLQLVASPCSGVGAEGGQRQLAASSVVGQRQRMILCDTSVSSSLPAPYDYFTTREVGATSTYINSDPIAPPPSSPLPPPAPLRLAMVQGSNRGGSKAKAHSTMIILIVQAATQCPLCTRAYFPPSLEPPSLQFLLPCRCSFEEILPQPHQYDSTGEERKFHPFENSAIPISSSNQQIRILCNHICTRRSLPLSVSPNPPSQDKTWHSPSQELTRAAFLCQDYDGVPYDIAPRPLYDQQTIDDMVTLGGEAGIPLGYSGPRISEVEGNWRRK
jgi:hypothetical protein